MSEAGATRLGEVPKGEMKESFWEKEGKVEEKAVNGQGTSLKQVCVFPLCVHRWLLPASVLLRVH